MQQLREQAAAAAALRAQQKKAVWATGTPEKLTYKISAKRKLTEEAEQGLVAVLGLVTLLILTILSRPATLQAETLP